MEQQHDQRTQTTDEDASRHRMPVWVRVVVVVGFVATAIVVTAMLLSGSNHGPGRHQPGEPTQTSTPHPSPVEHR